MTDEQFQCIRDLVNALWMDNMTRGRARDWMKWLGWSEEQVQAAIAAMNEKRPPPETGAG